MVVRNSQTQFAGGRTAGLTEDLRQHTKAWQFFLVTGSVQIVL